MCFTSTFDWKTALLRKEITLSSHLTEPNFGKCSEKHIFICSFKNNFFKGLQKQKKNKKTTPKLPKLHCAQVSIFLFYESVYLPGIIGQDVLPWNVLVETTLPEPCSDMLLSLISLQGSSPNRYQGFILNAG